MTGTTPTQKPPDDIDPKELVRAIDSHAKDMGNLSDRIKCLEDRVGSSLNLAKTLEQTAKDAVPLKAMLEENFIDLLQNNEKVKTTIKTYIASVDREYVSQKFKQYRTWIAAGFLFLVAQLSIELLKWIFEIIRHSVDGSIKPPL